MANGNIGRIWVKGIWELRIILATLQHIRNNIFKMLGKQDVYVYTDIDNFQERVGS